MLLRQSDRLFRPKAGSLEPLNSLQVISQLIQHPPVLVLILHLTVRPFSVQQGDYIFEGVEWFFWVDNWKLVPPQVKLYPALGIPALPPLEEGPQIGGICTPICVKHQTGYFGDKTAIVGRVFQMRSLPAGDRAH